MITDLQELESLREKWAEVKRLQNALKVGLFASMGMGIGGGIFPHRVADVCYCLIFVFACSVLEDALRQANKEQGWTPKRVGFEQLMKLSRGNVPWCDFNAVDEARKKRNKIGHERDYLSRDVAWTQIDVIERELKDWGVVL